MIAGAGAHTLAERLRATAAEAQPGDRMPSMRELTARYHVSPGTVSRVLSQLVAEGVVTTRPGAGTFAAQLPVTIPGSAYDHSWQTFALGSQVVDDRGMRQLADVPAPGVIPLASGYPHPSLTASRQLGAALTRMARRPGVWDRPPVAGIPSLRRWFAEGAGALVGEDDVLITSGAQSALSATLRALVAPGGPLLVESPTYPGVLAVARAAGLQTVPIPTDQDGLRTDLLADAFAATGARVVYCQPTFHNPTGSILSPARRTELLAVARDAGAFIVEDDWARWLEHEGTIAPPPLVAADRDGRVVHIRSLTKTLAPSLRVGALIARGPVAERLRALRLVDDFFVPRVLQEAAVELLTSTQWPRHLSALHRALRLRRAEMVASLAPLPLHVQPLSAAPGGLYVWARLDGAVDDRLVADAAQRAGVAVSAGRSYFPAEPTGDHLRLSFVGTAHPGELEDGIHRLATALR